MIWFVLACADPHQAEVVAPKPALAEEVGDRTVTLAGVQAQLELGSWSLGKIDALLASMAAVTDGSARLNTIAHRFVGTPFRYESLLPIPPPGAVRVRLESFDCTTFVITMLALAEAKDNTSFVRNLRELRYADPADVDSDPATGTILDFASDILVDSAVGKGLTLDVTAEIAGDTPLTHIRARQTARHRTAEYDRDERLVVPRLHANQMVGAAMIATRDIERVDLSRLQSGDILAFSRLDPDAPTGDGLLVSHLAIAQRAGPEVTLLHATRDYLWRPNATATTAPSATGVYYDNDPRREQLGVAIATTWVGDPGGRKIELEGHPYYGYEAEDPRPLASYLEGAHITAFLVLRPVAIPPTFSDPATRTPEVPVIDSAMTRAEAMEGVASDCPPELAASQELVNVQYRSMDGALHAGQLVIHERLAEEVSAVFAAIRRSGFPIRSALPMSSPQFRVDGRWDDNASMNVDNTSGFNYRTVPGSPVLSFHACGTAVDMNTRLNPYIRSRAGALLIDPPGAVYDPAIPGSLTAEGEVVRLFLAMGWRWGGQFQSLKDWQHFEKGCF
ncbi:hypothetical protein LBMAG42_22220 [Deltaproteobacteria bacterium]|nr:hypothetical protein LBMAG42_22220 [Deltaproteobacteria bacterium]